MAAVLVLAACGGGGDDDDGAASDATTTSTVAGDVAGEVGTTTTVSGDDGTTTTAAASTDGAAPSPAVAAPTADSPAPLAPGTYRYRQSGEIKAGPQSYPIPPEGTSEVEPATAEGTQLVRRYIDPEQSPAETRLRFDAAAISMTEVASGGGPAGFRCTFDPPLVLVAWPPTVGHTASGSTSCQNVDVTYETRITGRTPVTIDGATYEAFVMESTITTTGDFESTTRQVDHFVAELRMSTHTENDIQGTYQAFQFSGHTVADLVSAVPA
jgi:hypothetical protein